MFHVIRGNVVHRLGFRPLLLVFRHEPLIEEKPSIGIYDSERQDFVALLGMQAGGLRIEVDAVGIICCSWLLYLLVFCNIAPVDVSVRIEAPRRLSCIAGFSETLLF